MSLDVHLHGEWIGRLFPAGEGDYRLAYDPDFVARMGAGAPVLSASLPAREEPYSAEATRSYTEALLPDGRRRERIAAELGLDPADGYALLAELGRDCAGAVSFLREDGEEPAEEEVRWLGEEELAELVAQPPRRLFDPASPHRMRAALSGERHKLALVRDGERWGWPTPSVPSTHVVKPNSGEYPDLVANEMFCTEVARRAGLPVADTGVEWLGGRPCLVSERFDRAGQGTAARRVHAEDFCQALGYPPEVDLYVDPMDAHPEEEAEEGCPSAYADGPGFAAACGLLRALGREEDIATLLAAAFCNHALGNGDAHGKNYSLLFTERGLRLAPFYDISSTTVYEAPVHSGLVVADDYDARYAYLLEIGWIGEEVEFDFDELRDIAYDTAHDVRESLWPVAEQAREEGWHAPVVDEIVEMSSDRAEGLGFEVEY